MIKKVSDNMAKYEISSNDNNEILEKINKIILDKYPIVEDRTKMLYPTPGMKILFEFYKTNDEDTTQISFLEFIRSIHKYTEKNINEEIKIRGLINEETICKLISYLLTDHDYFSTFTHDIDSFNLSLGTNDCIENIRGISCGKINLDFNFSYHPEGKKLFAKYLNAIAAKFSKRLERMSDGDCLYRGYYNEVKKEFISLKTDEELKSFINLLNSDDILNIINKLPIERFFQLYNEFNKEDNQKILK